MRRTTLAIGVAVLLLLGTLTAITWYSFLYLPQQTGETVITYEGQSAGSVSGYGETIVLTEQQLSDRQQDMLMEASQTGSETTSGLLMTDTDGLRDTIIVQNDGTVSIYTTEYVGPHTNDWQRIAVGLWLLVATGIVTGTVLYRSKIRRRLRIT